IAARVPHRRALDLPGHCEAVESPPASVDGYQPTGILAGGELEQELPIRRGRDVELTRSLAQADAVVDYAVGRSDHPEEPSTDRVSMDEEHRVCRGQVADPATTQELDRPTKNPHSERSPASGRIGAVKDQVPGVGTPLDVPNRAEPIGDPELAGAPEVLPNQRERAVLSRVTFSHRSGETST